MANTIAGSVSGIMPNIIGNCKETLSQSFALASKCNKNFSDASGQIGQTVNIAVPAKLTAASVTAANTAPAPSDVTVAAKSMTISSYKKASFALSGTDVQNYNLESYVTEQVKEAIRAVAYQFNSDAFATVYPLVYNSVGSAGTGAFASSIDILSDADYELTKSLCPKGGRTAVISLKDEQAIKKLDSVQFANYAGDMEVRRMGMIPPQLGFDILADHQVPIHTTGTITTGAVVKAATTPAVGDTTLVCTTADSTGAVALKKGDVLTIAGYEYSLQADVTEASASTDFTITLDRGLVAAPSAGDAVVLATGHGTSLVNLAGDFRGVSVVTRIPASEIMGQKTQGDQYVITDEVSGLTMALTLYSQYAQVAMEVSMLYGIGVNDSDRLTRIYTYAS